MGDAALLAGALEQALGGALPVGVRTWDGGSAGPDTGPTVIINNRRALRRLLWRPGELGLARAYVTGDLDVDGDVKEGLRRCWAAVRGRTLARPRFGQVARAAVRLRVVGPPPRPPVQEARLTGRLHALRRDRAAISHHYDLGNDFYELILDPHMAYSCAWWESADTLEEAQRAKLDMVCRKLDLRPGSRLLDVGCGWGSLVLFAAAEYGAKVTGVTISRQQHDFVTRRARERGLDHLVTVRLRDYRHVGSDDADGPYDAVSSIEMGEHVGEENYPAYVRILHRNLAPGGRLVLQQMSRGRQAPGGGAFIESYIAPDMTMRPLHGTLAHLAGTGFEIREVLAMREHYARTIDAWAARLEKRWPEVAARVGDGWARVWRLYLAGSALAFEENRMGVDLVVAVA